MKRILLYLLLFIWEIGFLINIPKYENSANVIATIVLMLLPIIILKLLKIRNAGSPVNIKKQNLNEQEEKIKFENKCINLIKNKQIQIAYKEICMHKLDSIDGSLVGWESELENGISDKMVKLLIKLLNFNNPELEE